MGGALKRRKYDENYEVKAYEKFCKKLKFIEGKEITVKVNEKFAAKYYANFTVPPEYQGSFPVVKTNDDEITIIYLNNILFMITRIVYNQSFRYLLFFIFKIKILFLFLFI